MQFYRLTHPRYETTHAEETANPIRMITEFYYIPGVSCPACAEATGGGWASSDRVRVEVPTSPALRRTLMGTSLPLDQWQSFVTLLRRELAIPSWMPVTPGAQIGLPRAELLAPDVPDFLHPFPGQIIVRDSVVDALQRAELTGFVPVRVEVRWGKQVKYPPGEPPLLYELFVTGTAWRVGMDAERITACKECGRTIFPNPEWLVVDERRWDGSDFFHIDRNPNIVLVTERVCHLMAQCLFTNYACVPTW